MSTDYTGFPIFIPGGSAFIGKLPRFANRAAYVAAMGAAGTPVHPIVPFDTGALTRMHLVVDPGSGVPMYCIGYDPYPDANPYCGSLIAYWAGAGDVGFAGALNGQNYTGCNGTDVSTPLTSTYIPTLPLLTPNASAPVPGLYTSGTVLLANDGVSNHLPGPTLRSFKRNLIAYHPLKDAAEILGSTPNYTGSAPGSVPSYGMTVVTGSFTLTSSMVSGDTGGGTSFGLTSVLADVSLYFIDLDGASPAVFEVASLGTVSDSFTSVFNAIHSHATSQTIASQTVWVPQASFPTGVLPTRWMLAAGLKTLAYTLPTHDATLAGANSIQINCKNNGTTAPQAFLGFDDGSFTYPTCIPS